eukprot:COSAG01_NODE_737_length_13945_cov_10.858082_7_plen_492_part_00
MTSAIGWLPAVCNQWRTTSDNCNLAVDYSSLPRVLAENNFMAANARPGSWNDLDPVMIGAGIEGQLSVAEARSMFTLFAAVKAPLLLGSNPSRMGSDYLAIVKNAELIAVSQDSLGVAAVAVAAADTTVSKQPRRFRDDNNSAAVSCPSTPPNPHLCCDHPHCRERNESQCHAMEGCCYHGTTAHGQCWLNHATPPPPSPPPPPPSPQPAQPTPDDDGLLAFCQWGAGQITAAQQFVIDGSGWVQTSDGGRCLELLPSASLVLRACVRNKPAQTFDTRRVNETLAQIRARAMAADGPGCVGTDGRRLMMVQCLAEDSKCEQNRCAHSVLSNQLWYHSSMTHQLMSSFTSASIPPLRTVAATAPTSAAASSHWGPNNGSLVNIPLCLASSPNRRRPSLIPQPPAVLPATAPWPAQQVWAGKLSHGAFVVVLWNLGPSSAQITATWEAIGIPARTACMVRDLWKHAWLPNATDDSVGALVASHDVVALKLTPQ